MTDQQQWSLPNFVLGHILKATGWPRGEGLLVKKYVVDSRVLEAAVRQTLQVAAGIGAGRPATALRVIASLFRRDWSPAGVEDLMQVFDIEDRLKGQPEAAPWDAVSLMSHSDGTGGRIYFHESTPKVEWNDIWTEHAPLFVAPFAALVGWALINPSEVDDAVATMIATYNSSAPEAITHGLDVRPESAWQSAEEYYTWCDEIVGLFETERQPLPSVPSALAGAIQFAHRFKLDQLDFNKEIKLCDEAIRLNPQDADAYYKRGIANDKLGHHERAIQDYDDAIRFNPQAADAYRIKIGIAYENLRHESTTRDYDEAIRVNSQDADAYNNRGIAYDNLGQHERAIQDFDEAIRLSPQADAYKNNRGMAYDNLGQHGRAIRDYDDAIGLNPLAADAYKNRGCAYASLGELERAIQDYNEAIRLKYEHAAEVYNNRGLAYASLGEFERAIQDYDEAITHLNPPTDIVYHNRGVAYAKLGQYERAIQDYNEAIRLNPEDSGAYGSRGNSYTSLGQYERGIQDEDEAIRLNPEEVTSIGV